MSVLKKDQKETDIWFLMAICELCAEAAAMLEKRKKDKFYNAFAPYIMECTIKMYTEAQLANNIMISKTSPDIDLEERRKHFQSTLGYIDTYENLIKMYVTTAINLKTFNETKAFNFFEKNALKISKIRASIIKILKKDLDRARKLSKEKIKRETMEMMNFQNQWYKEQIEQRKQQKKIIQPIVFFDSSKNN